MGKNIQEYVHDLNEEIIEQWSEMISNINRNLAARYEDDTRTADEIFAHLESIYLHHVELNVEEYQFVTLEEDVEDMIL